MGMTGTKAAGTAREKLLQAALSLMLQRGYNATTVDEMCAQAGVSKGSFYHFFQSKDQIGLAALERYYEEGLQRLLGGRFMLEREPVARLLGFLQHVETHSGEFWGHGCLLGTFAIDLAETHPGIRRQVAKRFERLAEALSELFEPIAGPDGGHPTALELATGYLAALEGAIVLARAFHDPGRIHSVLEAYRRQLDVAGV
jgi:TetR/AcrR family transcriptional repressor of nem operon